MRGRIIITSGLLYCAKFLSTFSLHLFWGSFRGIYRERRDSERDIFCRITANLISPSVNELMGVRSSFGGARTLAAWSAALVLCLFVTIGTAEAAPAASHDSAEHQRRAAEDLWKEIVEGEGKADDHDHWERIVRRSVDWYDPYYSDDTQNIVNVQDYYRYVLEEQEWTDDTDPETELARLMHPFFDGDSANVQDGARGKAMDREKPIPGRYIVMLDSSADAYTLDRTIAVLQRAHSESEGRIRADHITPIRNLGVGFTATMNSKSVELVS